MNIRVTATVYSQEFFKEALQSADLVIFLGRAHDSIINDQSDFAIDQRKELAFAIKQIIKLRKENKK